MKNKCIDKKISLMISLLMAVLGALLVAHLVFFAIVIVGGNSYNESVHKKMVEESLLISNNTTKIDVRQAVKQQKYDSPEEQWKHLYQYPVTPDLNEPLSENEKTICQFIRAYEDGRTTTTTATLNDVSVLLPVRVFIGMFGDKRGGSVAFQSAVGKVLSKSISSKVKEIHLTAALSHLPEEYKCRLIISSLDATIVNEKGNNYQAIKGGYAMSDVIFQKPFNSLNLCELAFISTAFRTTLRYDSSKAHLNKNVYLYALENNGLNCPKFELMQEKLKDLNIKTHPIWQAVKYQDLPTSVDIKMFAQLKTNILKAKEEMDSQLNSKTVIEVAIKQGGEVIRVSSLNGNQGFDEKHSAASIVKLLVAKTAIENGEPIASEKLRAVLCHSKREAAEALFDTYASQIKKTAQKYELKHRTDDLQKAVTTENSGWSSTQILAFADDFAQILDKKPKIANAFGTDCTASTLRTTIQPRYALFAKTGTASNRGKTTAKLLLFALRDKNRQQPIIVLIRIEGENNKNGLCSGEGCFNNGLLKDYIKAILQFTDKNQNRIGV